MTFKRHLAAALLVLTQGCLVGVGWLIDSNQRAELASDRWETHSRVVIQQFGDLLSSLKDAETGQRGFIITGNPDYLEPYQASLAEIAIGLAELRPLTADDPEQQQRLDAITPLVAAKLADLKETIALRQTQGFPAASAAVSTQAGMKIMDEIRARVVRAEAHEAQLLKERITTHATANRKTTQSIMLGSALAGLALLLLFIRLRWELANRRQAQELVARQAAELTTLYATAPVGLFFYDTDLRYVRVNPAMAELNGLPAELHIGRTLRELLAPELADAVEPQVRQVLETGRPLLNCEVHGATAPRPGEPERHFLVSYHPVQAGDGTLRGVHGAVQEITERKRAEDALRESEQRFRAAVMASSDLMCRMSPDWREMRQLYDNHFVVDSNVSNADWLESYVYRDDQPRLMALVNEAIRTKGLFEMEHRIMRVDGSVGWMLSRAVPVLDVKGEIVEWFGTGSDVTEQKRAEQALRESERFLRSSLDALSSHIAVLDESGTILKINEAWQRFGDENGATGAGIAVGVNYLQHCAQLVSQDDQPPACVTGIYDIIAGRKTHFEMEYPCHSPTEQRWFVMRVTRFQNAGPVRIVIEHDNITDRKKAEEAVRESEERLRLAAEAAHFGMYDRDLAGAHFHVSAEIKKMLGYEPDEPLSHAQVMSHMHPDDRRAGLAAFLRACDPGGDGQLAIEQRIVRSDGAVRWIASVGRVLFEGGVPRRSIGFWVDITERSRLERETLEQARALADRDRRKDEFLAMLSHELRNPLAAMSNAVQLLHLHQSEEPLLLQGRGIIERQLGHLKHLVDDLLEVSRISTGRVQLRPEQIAIGFVVERALETAQPLIAQRRHTVTVSLPPEPLWLHADTARLEQVVVNLLTNAAKYTDAGGRIWLSVVREGDAAVLRVRDSGIGIAPELLPRIFDLFTQADRSLDRSQGGLGIGLCLVQRLVELHGGSVAAHSVLGQGSEFVVRLPLLLTALPALPMFPVPASDSARPPEKQSSGCRVLVVDDNVDAAQALARVLAMIGHEVRLAYDGPTGLQAALDYRPEVVLLDIGLPGLTGHEVAQRIRQQAALKNVVLVALTGYGRDTDRQRIEEAGFDHHLVKPASFTQIEDILLSVLERDGREGGKGTAATH